MNKKELTYFNENTGYNRIFKGIYNKYRSLGRLGGTVILRNMTQGEKEVLSNHLRRDYSRKASASFSVKSFEESLKHTRFASYSLEEILEWYFGVDLVSKAEEEAKFMAKRSSEFQALLSRHKEEPGGIWVQSILGGEGVGVRRVMLAYSQDSQELMQTMEWVCHALNILDNRDGVSSFRLPVLASLVTRDPHAFDRGTLAGDLLINALCIIYGLPIPSNSQEIAEVLYNGGILVDEISNFITTSGLLAYIDKRLHPVWKAALEEKEILQIPLANLVDIDKVISPIGRVYVVENPAVFSAILDGFEGVKGSPMVPPMVCSYGQLKLAGLVLLDKLAEAGMDIYYSGDFDPEGLLIADKLASRYGERFHLWRYGIEEYRKVFSDQNLSAKRLSILESVNYPGFQQVKEEMQERKKAGYQELLIHHLLNDVKKTMGL